jgi:hypothetical protein
LDTKGQHTTPRPPKLLQPYSTSYKLIYDNTEKEGTLIWKNIKFLESDVSLCRILEEVYKNREKMCGMEVNL